ncbi:MAG: N-6 DNA methylase [Bacteroidetes bacterium]|nr:N-6 DNA methylase [Bacteroidota bacterium]
MFAALYQKLYNKSENWVNEEELRQGWIIALTEALKIDIQAERLLKDASYNNVVIEFKSKGLFKGKKTSPAFKEAIYDRLLPYILKTAFQEKIDVSDYIGIAIDGKHICFAQVKGDKIIHGDLLPFSEVSVTMVARALQDSFRRALTAENLIADFGHSSSVGIQIMKVFARILSKSIQSENNKTKMLFEEWRTLFGQVADLSSEQIDTIKKTLRFEISAKKKDKIPAALFIIHSFNSLLIKLLAAEIISSHELTSYKHFAQNLSVQSDSQLLNILSERIEKGHFFSQAGINGFVEEALFSWYLDASQDTDDISELISAIRELLIKLSFYRTDNLTQARSHDLLKLFYQNIVPETLRKTLGEFYTPDWLVDFTLDKLKINWLENRSLDPTCGSGSFLLEIIERKMQASIKAGWNAETTLTHLTNSVWGFDLNPLAVQTARVNFLIAIADLMKSAPGTQIEIPILLADAIYSPARDPYDNEDIVKYRIGSQIADLEITLPAQLAFDRIKLDRVFELLGSAVENGLHYSNVETAFSKAKILSEIEIETWKKPIEATYNKVLRLHNNNWNGIWFRIIRNFFWSSTAGKFDLIAGNPPWVRWSKLPELYRERVKPTCLKYNIFSSTPHHGGNELDISGMITYTVADKWLNDNGTLAFIITQTHFQSPSSEGFRDFVIDADYNLNPVSVDDMKALKPFPDAANKTAIAIFKKEKQKATKYPIKYTIWNAREGYPRLIPTMLNLQSVTQRIAPDLQEANPVTTKNSPWAILPKGRFKVLNRLAGKSDWVHGRKGITADLNGIYFVEILAENSRNNLVQIRTRPEAGKTDIGPAQEFWVEPDLLFPLIKGASDISPCHFNKDHFLYAFIPNRGIVKKAYEAAEEEMALLRKTSQFFNSYKDILSKRSTFKGRMKNAPFFAVYNVGEYTFAPWKVIWAEQREFCAAVVSSAETPFMGERPLIPDHKIFFVDFEEEAPAYYLCGLLNCNSVVEYVKSHNISIQIGDVFKHMKLPIYDPKDKLHNSLVSLVKRAHQESKPGQRDAILQKISQIADQILHI